MKTAQEVLTELAETVPAQYRESFKHFCQTGEPSPGLLDDPACCEAIDRFIDHQAAALQALQQFMRGR